MTKKESKIESRCGILCSECKYKKLKGCTGCTKIKKPFWGDSCPVKDCCEERGHEHCGKCANFPCNMLNDFAYDKNEGDDGKRIETCRKWFVEGFIDAVVTQNAAAMRDYFTPDAIICWHDSNEMFCVDEYIKANCEYPGDWQGEVKRVEKIDNGIITTTKLMSVDSSHFVTSYITLKNGKISNMDEYYSNCDEAPTWRKDMKIGKLIIKS